MDNNDIELFSTTDFKAKDKVVSILVRHRVSYLERWEKVPLLRRREYGGAKELCVIYVNGNQYEKAKKILDEFNRSAATAKKAKRRKRRAEAEAARELQEQEMYADSREQTMDEDSMQGVTGSTGYIAGDIDDGIDDI